MMDSPRQWTEIDVAVREKNYPRRLSLRVGPAGQVAWMLVSSRHNETRQWELFQSRIMACVIRGKPRLVFLQKGSPPCFRDLTYRPGRSVPFLREIVSVLCPREIIDFEGLMKRLVDEFILRNPEWATPGDWRRVFLQGNLPLFRQYPQFRRVEGIPSPLVDGFKIAEPEAIAWWFTGSRGKKTRQALYERLVHVLMAPKPEWGPLVHLRMIRKLGVSPEQIRQILSWPASEDRENQLMSWTAEHLTLIRRFLRTIPTERRFKFVKDNYFWAQPSWNELHDLARYWLHQSVDYRKLSAQFASLEDLAVFTTHAEYVIDNRSINSTSWSRSIPPETDHGWSLQVPESTRILARWGIEFRNCAATYVPQVLNHQTNVVRVLKDGKARFMLEVKNDRLVQLFGVGNQAPDPNDREDLVRWMQERELIGRVDLVV